MEIAGYSQLRSIGAGATSEVFEAYDNATGKKCALKRFNAFVSVDPDSRHRIDLEYQTLKQLCHPNIVKVEGVFQDQANFGLKLELVEGGSLTQWSRNYDWPLIEPKLHVLAQIARALGAAHASEILHRDLKPENVLISDSGDVKLTDFGLARSLTRVTMTKSGMLIGSLAYMAPEIIALDDASASSDLFSFGVIAYEMLTGKSPYQAETPQGLIRQMESNTIKDPSLLNPLIPPRISKLILSCLSKDPTGRPASSWHVEAEIMTALFESGLIEGSRKWISSSNRADLPAALGKKHLELKKRHAQSQTKSEKLQILNEMKILFPQDQELTLLMNQFMQDSLATNNQVKNRKTRTIALALLLLAVFVGVATVLSKLSINSNPPITTAITNPTKKTEAEPLTPPASGPSLPSTPKAMSVTAKPEPTRNLAPASPPNFGFLNLQVPSEVDVFVGGKFIPFELREKLKLETGKHLVKMVMDGYLPIENTVVVKPGKVTLVKAGGAQ